MNLKCKATKEFSFKNRKDLKLNCALEAYRNQCSAFRTRMLRK